MKPYSDYAPQLTRQVICDVIGITLILIWIRVGRWVHAQIDEQRQWGERMEDAGAGFRITMTDVGETLGNVPLIGDSVRGPFDVASNAGAELEAAGQYQQDTVGDLALIAGLGVALLPILSILALWLVPRLRFARRAHRARVLANTGAGLDLFAFRALVNLSPSALLKAHQDPVAAWRAQDPEALTALARLELVASGVKLRDAAQAPGE